MKEKEIKKESCGKSKIKGKEGNTYSKDGRKEIYRGKEMKRKVEEKE